MTVLPVSRFRLFQDDTRQFHIGELLHNLDFNQIILNKNIKAVILKTKLRKTKPEIKAFQTESGESF